MTEQTVTSGRSATAHQRHESLAFIERGSGPAVVFLHAFPVDSRMWMPQIGALEGSYKVIAPDYPGFGSSPHPPALPDIEYYAERVEDLLNRLEIEQAVLAGLSMGGYIAFACWRLFPQRISALVLADTHAAPDTEEIKKNRKDLARRVAEEGLPALAEVQLQRLLAPETLANNSEAVELVRRMILTSSPDGAVAALSAMRERPDSRPLLSGITVPTLVLGGELDTVTPPEVMRQMASQIPEARHEVIPQTAHLSNLESPREFNAALKGFLKGVYH